MANWKKCIASIVFLLGICLVTSCGQDTSATTMCLARTQGTVKVADGGGGEVALAKNLKLYSGYHVGTEKTAYAWINLDNVKLTKLDEASEVEVRKEDRNLELLVTRGNLFFHVTEPLSEEESLDIRFSDMTVGIRGTCGWVSAWDETHMQVYILEGTVTCQTGKPGAEEAASTEVSGGEMAELTVTDGEPKIMVREFSLAEVPAFVQQELEEEGSVNDRINETFGTDVGEWFRSAVTLQMPVTDREIQDCLNQGGGGCTVVVEPGEGENVLTIADDLTVNDGQTVILRDGIDVVLDGEEEETVFLSLWGTWKMQGNLMIGMDGFFANDGTTILDGNIMNYGAFQNYATMIVTGRIEAMPQIRESGDSYAFWSAARLENLSGYLYVGQGIRSEGEVILQDGARLDGTVTLLKGVREAGGRTWDTEGQIRRRDENGRYKDEE